MNTREVTMLARLVRTLCPAQLMDEYTPDAWALVLGGTSYDDAKLAAGNLAALPLEPGRSRYIEPGHILAEVQRIHAKRFDSAKPSDPPPGLNGDDTRAYLDWLRSDRQRTAGGLPLPTYDTPELVQRPMSALLRQPEKRTA